MAQIGIAFNEAVRNGHEAVVKLLLESGYNLEPANASDINPLTLAAGNGHKAIVQMLLTLPKGPESEKSISMAMYQAAENGHDLVVKVLLGAGADTGTVPDGRKYLPLHRAAKRGHVAVVKQLLEHKAGPQPDDSEHTPHTSLPGAET